MIESIHDLLPLAPEIALTITALLVLMLGAFFERQSQSIGHSLSVLGLVVTGFLVILPYGDYGQVLGGLFMRDSLSYVLKIFIVLTSLIVLIYGSFGMSRRNLLSSEFYALMLFAVLGMMLLCSASNLLTIYLGLELLALSSYALVALDRDNPTGSEAAMKYFVLGAIASGMLLYGMSLLYGITGELDLGIINEKLKTLVLDPDKKVILTLALVFIVAGLAFKFGAVPFHMWLPDVYQGAPTAVTMFLAAAPKLAAAGMAFRLLPLGMGPLFEQWQLMLAALAAGSLVLGNLAALVQTNLKRMLAYSTISHVGFICLGLLQGGPLGMSSVLFYVIVYALSTTAAFGVMLALSKAGQELEEIDDFRGLNQRHPFYAFLMLLTMGTLAGFPPLIGFFAKLQVLQAAFAAGFVWLVILAAICAVIGAYYYLNIVKVMYFDAPAEDDVRKADAPFDVKLVLTLNALAFIALGLFWGPLATLCASVWKTSVG